MIFQVKFAVHFQTADLLSIYLSILSTFRKIETILGMSLNQPARRESHVQSVPPQADQLLHSSSWSWCPTGEDTFRSPPNLVKSHLLLLCSHDDDCLSGCFLLIFGWGNTCLGPFAGLGGALASGQCRVGEKWRHLDPAPHPPPPLWTRLHQIAIISQLALTNASNFTRN